MADLSMREKHIILVKYYAEPKIPIRIIADGICRHPFVVYRFLHSLQETGQLNGPQRGGRPPILPPEFSDRLVELALSDPTQSPLSLKERIDAEIQ